MLHHNIPACAEGVIAELLRCSVVATALKPFATELIMTQPKTSAAQLAADYVKLGGTRLGKLDDNIVETRQWDREPKEAAAFWDTHIETLSDEERREVETNLPTMNFE